MSICIYVHTHTHTERERERETHTHTNVGDMGASKVVGWRQDPAEDQSTPAGFGVLF